MRPSCGHLSPVVYEDEHVFIYEKPAGWVCASPNPKVKTTYSAVKAYLKSKTEELVDVHFVNKLPREASGLLVVAKSLAWRQHLQSNWASLPKACTSWFKVICPPTMNCSFGPSKESHMHLPYRTMRATNLHTMLKFRAGYEVIKDMLPALRREDCLLIGVGKSAPDPIKRGGIHLFACPLLGQKGGDQRQNSGAQRVLEVGSRGSSPKPAPRKRRIQKKRRPSK